MKMKVALLALSICLAAAQSAGAQQDKEGGELIASYLTSSDSSSLEGECVPDRRPVRSREPDAYEECCSEEYYYRGNIVYCGTSPAPTHRPTPRPPPTKSPVHQCTLSDWVEDCDQCCPEIEGCFFISGDSGMAFCVPPLPSIIHSDTDITDERVIKIKNLRSKHSVVVASTETEAEE